MPYTALQAVLPLLPIVSSAMEASYFASWDKVGAVALSVAMIGILVGLHRSGLARVDAISDRLMKFVEEQTKVMTQLVESNRHTTDSANGLHARLDMLLTCGQPECPFLTMRRKKTSGMNNTQNRPAQEDIESCRPVLKAPNL
jgi:hypothetical protein